MKSSAFELGLSLMTKVRKYESIDKRILSAVNLKKRELHCLPVYLNLQRKSNHQDVNFQLPFL